MNISWRAVIYGLIGTVVIGLLSGAAVPYTDATLPTIGWGLTGLLGGLIAGYIAGGSLGRGALHGALATTIGSVLALAVLVVIGTLVAGLLGLGLLGLGLLFIVVYAIPGAVGGAVGSALKGRSARARTGQPSA
ncbi:DUF5518 domain-containing protein [Halegenticoccus soli]|uniref:DUF5518 domain-containing protein n=1 Tax=Halegenticoccus soli TaxID=1985678 RepID=UPI000C6EAEAB|nr:DUF5518 domain-containing protein [Halegenticoccus soli]